MRTLDKTCRILLDQSAATLACSWAGLCCPWSPLPRHGRGRWWGLCVRWKFPRKGHLKSQDIIYVSTTLSFHMYFQYNRRSHQKMGRFVQCQQLEQKVVIILHKVKSCFDIAEPKIIDQWEHISRLCTTLPLWRDQHITLIIALQNIVLFFDFCGHGRENVKQKCIHKSWKKFAMKETFNVHQLFIPTTVQNDKLISWKCYQKWI